MSKPAYISYGQLSQRPDTFWDRLRRHDFDAVPYVIGRSYPTVFAHQALALHRFPCSDPVHLDLVSQYDGVWPVVTSFPNLGTQPDAPKPCRVWPHKYQLLPEGEVFKTTRATRNTHQIAVVSHHGFWQHGFKRPDTWERYKTFVTVFAEDSDPRMRFTIPDGAYDYADRVRVLPHDMSQIGALLLEFDQVILPLPFATIWSQMPNFVPWALNSPA